ncbi:MAG: hypothetical protein GKR97_19030 [Rhizobiaceae bacterium]|nr:hypothetical protein [Rhizobiaceae bacterium]
MELIERAMRLDPHGKMERAHLLGSAVYCAGRHKASLFAYRQITTPRYDHCAIMAACLGQLTKSADAASLANATLSQKPNFSIEDYVNSLPFVEKAGPNHLVEGLRKGGLPN